MPYLAHFSLKWKNKITLFSSTLKVEEIRVVLFFHFKPIWARYGRFLVYKEISTKRPKGNLGPNQDRTKNTSERSEIFFGVSGTLMEPEKQGFKFRFWNHHLKGGLMVQLWGVLYFALLCIFPLRRRRRFCQEVFYGKLMVIVNTFVASLHRVYE